MKSCISAIKILSVVLLGIGSAACAPPRGPGLIGNDRRAAEVAPAALDVRPGLTGASAPQAAPPRVERQPAEVPPPTRFEDAVMRAGDQLFEDMLAEVGKGPRAIVIDPLIDANTGSRTVSTVRMGQQLESLLKLRRYSNFTVKPLTRQNLVEQPLLLIGTLTPVNLARAGDTPPDAFQIWLTVIDLKTGRVVAKQLDRATVDSVNAEPLPYFRDSPSWHKDKTVAGYINSCQANGRIGDRADPDYLSRLPAAAVINEAILAYDDGKLGAANALYIEASRLADGADLRVLNGLYLTNWQLGQREAAQDAFGRLVASGLEAGHLPMKLLFRAGTANFNNVGDLAVQYQLWLSIMAREAGRVSACLKVVGHTSRTGSASANERLSLRRAEAVSKQLEGRDRSLRSRLSVGGVGSREALVGLGTDDQRDALDRRVEFRVVECLQGASSR